MELVPSMGEMIGYVASGLIFLAFWMKTMMPLRLVAIASNIAFIAFGTANNLVPILVLHSLLFPLNLLKRGKSCSLLAPPEIRKTRSKKLKTCSPT
jgi:hypothetical protein